MLVTQRRELQAKPLRGLSGVAPGELLFLKFSSGVGGLEEVFQVVASPPKKLYI